MRSNTLDAARRGYLGLARGTIHQADDKPKMQTSDVRVLQNELLTGVERFQPYGHSSVPMPPDKDGKAAEAIIGFVNGSRSHPVVLAVDDRRYRPKNWKAGDAGTYHHSGAFAKHTDDGFVHDQGDKKKPLTWTTGKGSVKIEDGKVTITDDKATVVVSGSKITCTVGGTVIELTDGKIALGGSGASIPVMLQTGPSSLVFATK